MQCRGRWSLSGQNFLYVWFDYNDVSCWLLFSGENLWSCLGVLLGSYLIYGMNQVSLRPIRSGTPICELHFTRSVQSGGILTSLMNGTEENSSSKTTWYLFDAWPVAVLRTRDTDPAWNDYWPSYIPVYEWGPNLGNPSMLPFNLAPKT